jgi:hypothetical protein
MLYQLTFQAYHKFFHSDYFWELINLMPVMELFGKSLPPPPGLPNPIQSLLRRHQRLRTCIPGLEGALMSIVLLRNMIARQNKAELYCCMFSGLL